MYYELANLASILLVQQQEERHKHRMSLDIHPLIGGLEHTPLSKPPIIVWVN
jgi:hypothetical protein